MNVRFSNRINHYYFDSYKRFDIFDESLKIYILYNNQLNMFSFDQITSTLLQKKKLQ